MGKPWGAVVVLLIAAGTFSHAAVYKCQRPDGSVVYMDDPGRADRDCRLERIETLPELNILPDPAPQLVPAAKADGQTASPVAEDVANSLASYQEQASRLVDQYQVTRRKMVHSVLAGEQLQARRELAEIRRQKDVLLDEIDRAALSGGEKSRLREQLAPIVE